MSKKDIADIDDEDQDDDLNNVRDSVFRSILKNNRLMLRQNERIIEILEKVNEG